MAGITQGLLPMGLDGPHGAGARQHLRGVPVGPARRKDESEEPMGDRSKGSTAELFSSQQEDVAVRRDGSVSGRVVRIVHCNMETGFHVLRVALDDVDSRSRRGQDVCFVGICEPVAAGDRVEGVGQWERSARYGRQLKARHIRVLKPSTGNEIYIFLKNGGVKGVGERSAAKLRDHYGDDLVKVMSRPTMLMAAGVTERQAEAISAAWTRRTTHTEVLSFLQTLSIGPAMAERIIKRYGEGARQVVLENPYRMIREVPGLGFKTADQMALTQGISRTDARRVDAAIRHVMSSLGRDGHCACPRARILKEVGALLSIPDRGIRAGVDRLIASRALIEEENGGSAVIYDVNVLKCEEEIARRIAIRTGQVELPDDIDARIQRAAQQIGIAEIHEHQALAVRASLGARFSVITGGPGSGKTSSLEVLLRVFEDMNPGCKIILSAPTGRAAQRMSESTGREASTIHRMLEWGPERRGFQVNEDNPLRADLVVVDEASMLDIWLARDVLRALEDNAHVVLVGDVDQLPSVGAGRVLGDVIESGVVPVTRLTRIFRQGAGSLIAESARVINSGRLPHLSRPNRKTDMWALWHDDPGDCLDRIIRLVTEIGPKLGLDPFRDIQILTGGHGGTLGTVNLNAEMQKALNPETPDNPGIDVGDRRLRVGDRVLQMTNNYDLDVFNGDIGQVVSLSPGRRAGSARVRVAFDGREVEYSGSDARELNHAYAISVHKSQGSEFPFVIFASTTQHYAMLRKTLAYTAVTRARDYCAIVGQEKAMRISVSRTDAGRTTGLAKRLVIEAAELDRHES